MSIPVVSVSNSEIVSGSLTSSDTGKALDDAIEEASELVKSAQNVAMPTLDEQIAYMRRRLFRTLDRPDRCIIAIDCGSLNIDQIHETTDLFLNDSSCREKNNLVLAVPADLSCTDASRFEWVQTLKQRAFENGLDGKVSWLLIHHPDSELAALKSLVNQQRGQWYGS
ncbi:hypothetical protein [Allorhodopirellula solitaria]|uniref:Uncharacterized protein n=1 Tax=Allorhodopirellula solitaria TaxID=2527987 RepID=A0A5C5YGB7_9BACT|nr:hypothetical protein [Allorhodopirellula solitaria]TWT74164.1 hypothetical protein CA85_10510 [Allorhodopirellula solitaria]